MGKVRIRIRDEQPIFINHFWVKMLEFFVADPGFGMEKILIRVYLIQIRDPGWKKFGSAIRPGSATLTSKKHFAKDLLKLCCCRGALASRHRPSGEALRAQILRRASASAMSASSSLSSFYTVRSQKIAEVCRYQGFGSGSGFNQVSGSGSVFGIRIQEGKNYLQSNKSRKKLRNFMF
jgi:hypothetical protein